jgi:hypothetical protein
MIALRRIFACCTWQLASLPFFLSDQNHDFKRKYDHNFGLRFLGLNAS